MGVWTGLVTIEAEAEAEVDMDRVTGDAERLGTYVLPLALIRRITDGRGSSDEYGGVLRGSSASDNLAMCDRSGSIVCDRLIWTRRDGLLGMEDEALRPPSRASSDRESASSRRFSWLGSEGRPGWG